MQYSVPYATLHHAPIKSLYGSQFPFKSYATAYFHICGFLSNQIPVSILFPEGANLGSDVALGSCPFGKPSQRTALALPSRTFFMTISGYWRQLQRGAADLPPPKVNPQASDVLYTAHACRFAAISHSPRHLGRITSLSDPRVQNLETFQPH